MATTILFVLFVTLLFRAALLLPVSQVVKSVQSSDNVGDVEPNKMTGVFNPDTILSRAKDVHQVNSLDSVNFDRIFDVNSVKRTKRQVVNGFHRCAQGMVWYLNMCITQEKYAELNEGDEYDDES